MIVILSPAKRLNFEIPNLAQKHTIPSFMGESEELVEHLKKMSARKLQKLMKINDNLAESNYERYQNWTPEFNEEVAKPAILAFRGDVFLGMDPQSFDKKDFDFAQEHVRILSGLHGILKPLDLIRPYRLEMGTQLRIGKARNLYEFWGDKITNSITGSQAYQSDKTLVNLASKEYAGSVNMDSIQGRVIEPAFKEYKNGSYRPVHIFMKRARGMMTSYLVKNRIEDPEKIKLFDWDGYEYNDQLTRGNQWVFTRG
jgi:cytoplasmic iron level regulating protein YaaA (DUF328/UPF0246 family)